MSAGDFVRCGRLACAWRGRRLKLGGYSGFWGYCPRCGSAVYPPAARPDDEGVAAADEAAPPAFEEARR